MYRNKKKDTEDGFSQSSAFSEWNRSVCRLHLIAFKHEIRTQAVVHEYVCEYLGGKDVGDLRRE